jgi:CrcB protein
VQKTLLRRKKNILQFHLVSVKGRLNKPPFYFEIMNALALLYVGFGGAFGAMLRYSLVGLIAKMHASDFPFGTIVVNVAGSFLMGVWLAAMTVMPTEKAKDLHLLFAVGALGGFTTFSAFSFDVFSLGEREMYMGMALYIGASVILSLIGLLLGIWLVKIVAA